MFLVKTTTCVAEKNVEHRLSIREISTNTPIVHRNKTFGFDSVSTLVSIPTCRPSQSTMTFQVVVTRGHKSKIGT